MSETASWKLSVVEARDADFDNAGDMQAEIGLTIKF